MDFQLLTESQITVGRFSSTTNIVGMVSFSAAVDGEAQEGMESFVIGLTSDANVILNTLTVNIIDNTGKWVKLNLLAQIYITIRLWLCFT